MAGEKIAEIKSIFENATIEEYEDLFLRFSEDDRAGVLKIIEKYKKVIANRDAEIKRLFEMSSFEREYSDYEFICGIDEVGRGPLAGPVCAGAVILPKDAKIMYINDSKKLSAKKRDELYDEIMEKAICAKTAFIGPEVIDEINILQATYEAMRTAINNLCKKPDILLNDAVKIPNVDIKQISIIKGDAKSVSIAAASIVAKVERDRMMEMYDELYPEYGFAKNKGYGSAEHIAAIKKYGPCPIHRRSFIGGIEY